MVILVTRAFPKARIYEIISTNMHVKTVALLIFLENGRCGDPQMLTRTKAVIITSPFAVKIKLVISTITGNNW